MKKRFIFLFFSVLVSQAYADDKKGLKETRKKSFTEKLFFTGNLGLSFGNSTNILISPGLGYRVSNKLGAGVGYSYGFNSDSNTNLKVSNKVHGPRVFALYKLMPNLYATTRYEYLKQKITNEDLVSGAKLDFKRDSDAWYLGAGYRLGGLGGIGFGIEILYDVLHDEESFNSEALSFQGGLSYGF